MKLPLILAAAGALCAPALSAQTLSIGDRVRLLVDRPWQGSVQRVTADTLSVWADGMDRPVAFPIADIDRLEVMVGERSRARGFFVGALIGAAVGAGGAAALRGEGCENVEPDPLGGTTFCEQIGPVAIVGAGLFGVAVGGGVGALLWRGERWERVPLPGTAALLVDAAGAGRLALGLRLPAGAPR